MDGRKRVAIISDAASTGISLHAAPNSGASDRRRVHYTIELPWAADKAIQQLGRTHRSGQVSAPVYKMVVTELGGERRFAAAVAKRMAGLGALTKGDRRAASGSDLSEFDIDSRFGRRALRRFYDCAAVDPPVPPSKTSHDIVDSYIGSLGAANPHSMKAGNPDDRLFVLYETKESLESIGIDTSTKNSEVRVFLNRISALTVAKQNLVFSLFSSTMEDVIGEAKATGEFEGSVEDVRATSIKLFSPLETLTSDTSSGALTNLATFKVDRGCSFSAAVRMCVDMVPSDHKGGDIEPMSSTVARSGFYMSRGRIAGRFLVLFAKRKSRPPDDDDEHDPGQLDPRGLMVLTRPNTGTNRFEKSTEDLERKYRLVASVDDVGDLLADSGVPGEESAAEAVARNWPEFNGLWTRTYTESDGYRAKNGLAPRLSKIGLVTGAVLHCLPALEKSVASRTLSERSLKIIRVELSGSGRRFVGMKYPVDGEALGSLRSALSALGEERGGASFSGFVDEPPSPLQGKSIAWLTSPPVTMESFFGAATKGGTKRGPPGIVGISQNKKVSRPVEKKKKVVRGKTSAITSFFNRK